MIFIFNLATKYDLSLGFVFEFFFPKSHMEIFFEEARFNYMKLRRGWDLKKTYRANYAFPISYFGLLPAPTKNWIFSSISQFI